MMEGLKLPVTVPGEAYQRELISCQMACPVHTDARGYVRAIAEGRFEEAYLIARGPNPFASICGRICGAPCETDCRRGKIPRVDDDGKFVANDRPIAIRALKRFACELFGPEAQGPGVALRNVKSFLPPMAGHADEMAALLKAGVDRRLNRAHGEKVAIVGAGPAGLSAAHDLALLGFRPVVFEQEPVPAGMLAVGVPAYRLPREVIAKEVAVIEALGVEIHCGVKVGRDVSFAQLRRDYSAILIAAGAKTSRQLGLPGERGPRVYSGVDMLRAVALGEPVDIGKDVVVVGGGNVAYDVARSVVRQIAYDTARTAARLPGTSKVSLVSLEGLEEMPADTVEIREGDEEGVQRLNGWGPLEIQRRPDGSVSGILFRKCTRVYDENRRFAPLYDDQVTHFVPCDTVLMAVGQSTSLEFLSDGGEDVGMMRPGWPKVDRQTLRTTADRVFVAGDLAHGTRLLIDAVASGKAAARSIYEAVTGHKLEVETVASHRVLELYRRERGYENIRRQEIPTSDPNGRLRRPDVCVETGYTQELAMREASRCLDCGVAPIFDGSRCVLCGGCVDVCPTECLKLVPLSDVLGEERFAEEIRTALGDGVDLECNSAILKDEDRCIRCGLCAMRCPVEAITMERVAFRTIWRSNEPGAGDQTITT
jgi:NADPH-dependent glutamate synthase beta subunit-like oxidoreductase